MAQNPATHPATILPGANKSLAAYDQYQNQLRLNIEQKRQREELKKQKLDESLIPPEIDYKGLFPGDAQEILDDVAKYQELALSFADKGIDWRTNPQGIKMMKDAEGKIRDKVLQSNQDVALAKNFIDKSSSDAFDNDFMREESYDKYTKWQLAGQKGGITGRKNFLQQAGGLLVEKPWDHNAFMTEYTKDIDLNYLTDEQVESSKVPGYKKQTRTFYLSPEELAGRTSVMVSDPNYKKNYALPFYNSLTPDQQTNLAATAKAKGYTDPLQVIAEEDMKKYLAPKQDIKDIKMNLPKSTSPKNKDDYSETEWLVSKLAAARSGDVSGLTEVYYKGQQYYSLDIPKFFIGKYTDYVPETKDPETGVVLTPASQQQVPEYIEEIVYDPRTHKWYGYTNKTLSKGKTYGDVNTMPKPYGWEINDNLWTMILRGIVLNNGTTNKFSMKDLQSLLKQKGAATDTGDIDWNILAPLTYDPTANQTLPKKQQQGQIKTPTGSAEDDELYPK